MYKLALFVGTILIFFSLVNSNYKYTDKPESPNILWIVSEDNSPFLGAYNDEFADTPNLDRFAEESIIYDNAYATTPVCAPSRFTLITGMYASIMGSENMRSNYPIPDFIKFFPKYLRDAGYYCTNNSKEDYNTINQPNAWDESSNKAHYSNRQPNQPFFHVKNIGISHESSLHDSIPVENLNHDPDKVPIPPYHPKIPAVKHDWAQYYDKISEMDQKVGEVLDELEEEGLADNTIVFYYSDHGGALARSKAYMYESGLRIPLIIHIPEKFKKFAPLASGSHSERLVSFVDFAPTVLSLADIKPPKYMHGGAFLGRYKTEPHDYIYAYRGRRGERRDLVRVVRDKQYLYKRNYMPHRIYGQYNEYLWRAPHVQEWKNAYDEGSLNKVQSRFWESKPVEELYDVKQDPHNVHNLVNESEYENVLKRMREANRQFIRYNKDIGFLPESMIGELSKKSPAYESVREEKIPIERIIETAEIASEIDSSNIDELSKRLNSENLAVRFWAAQGFVMLKKDVMNFKDKLFEKAKSDSSLAVRIALSEAIYNLGNSKLAMEIINIGLKSSQEMIRLQALNVLSNLELKENDLPSSIISNIKRISKKEWSGSGGYDMRVAKRLVEKTLKD